MVDITGNAASGIAGALYGGGFGLISVGSDIDFIGATKASTYINDWLEANDPTKK